MISRLQQKRKDDSGFTLIELLIVIIILGILAAIVVFAVGNTRKDSVASSCKTNFKSIELSAEAVNTKTGSYPAAAGTNGGTNLVSPANGALLKAYPTSTDYNLVYTQSAAVVGPPAVAAGASFTLTVKDNAATPVTKGTTIDACDLL